MKKSILLLFVTIFLFANAQENYSTIYFWQEKVQPRKSKNFNLVMNNFRVTSYSNYELIELKSYTKEHFIKRIEKLNWVLETGILKVKKI